MKVYFLTFGSNGYEPAVHRLYKQAEEFQIFDKIFGLTTEDLLNTIFWRQHSEFILSNPRGFGYWIWKPYLINALLKQIDDDDVILYLDCGCELFIKQKDKLVEQINTVKEYYGTPAGSDDIMSSKHDLLHHFSIDFSDKEHIDICNMPHVQAGALLIKKTKTMSIIIDLWYNLCCNYHFIDDSPSVLPNHPKFIEHRHDQSVLNMILKTYGYLNYKLYSTMEGTDNEYPIWYARNKTGTSLQ